MIGIIFFVIAVAESAKLNNVYLPPPPARGQQAGGSEGELEVPLEPPYIDSYSPSQESSPSNEEDLQSGETNPLPPLPANGKFLSGSYTYTGPDNVLVTVTFKANDEEREGKNYNDEEDDSINYGSIEKPVTLPKSLSRALNFSREKKTDHDEDYKRNRDLYNEEQYNKKHKPTGASHHKSYDSKHQQPTKGLGGKKNEHAGEGYQYQRPIVHGGYSHTS